MRKNISITNNAVLELFSKQSNVSKYIETAVLAYEDYKQHDYITRAEVLELLAHYIPQDKKLVQDVSKNDIKTILDL